MPSTFSITLPGDTTPLRKDTTVTLGPGLQQSRDTAVSTAGGVLHNDKDGESLWVDAPRKRYVAAVGEPVVGIVTGRMSEAFRVDIGTASPATLPMLAFEGATKRNKPNVTIGALVYARVSSADRDMDPEIVCAHPTTNRSDGFGELKDGGYLVSGLSLGLCRSLLAPNAPIFKAMSASFPFETAVGMNGRVWVRGGSIKDTMVAIRALQACEGLDLPRCKKLLKQLNAEI